MRPLALALPFLAEAFGVLLADRARTFLTILGLIVGVAAVIAIAILGHGMSSAVTGVLGSLSDRSFFLFPNARQANFTEAAFTVRDIERARAAVPNVLVALPAGNVDAYASAGHAHPRLGISADSDVAFASVPLVYGRNLSPLDVASAAHVCVLTHDAYEKLFPGGGDATGRRVRVGERRYTVVGVQGRPTQGILPINFAGDVHVPYTTFEREYLRAKPLAAARFITRDAAQIATTEASVEAFLTSEKRGHPLYQTFDRKTFSSSVDGIFAALTLVVALIGAVSLVVAGINIMNMMLVSVSERTREIGVRKAIGATSNQILAQFFIEALLLSLAGCGVGLGLGLGIGYLVDRFALVAISGIVPDIPWLQSVAVAAGFATLVTLVFGTYPAYRAARLDPIEALRYE